jgi:hypothetical protein
VENDKQILVFLFNQPIPVKEFPASPTTPITSSTICTDQQLVGVLIVLFSQYMPPLPDAFDRKFRSVTD